MAGFMVLVLEHTFVRNFRIRGLYTCSHCIVFVAELRYLPFSLSFHAVKDKLCAISFSSYQIV